MSSLFAGNESAMTVLKHAVKGANHHAYLIYGEEGLGKRTFAMLFAKAFLCTARSGRPCGVCRSCKKVENQVHPDLKILIGEKRGSIHVESVREIRKGCVVKPNDGELKIYLIANIQHMTEEAFNAFLKTLEEPPLHTVFILTAEHLDQLPETVVSRVSPVELYPVPEESAALWLRKRFPETPLEECLRAAQASGGNLGKAEKRLSSPELSEISGTLKLLCSAVSAKREYDLLKALAVYEKDKAKQVQLLGEFLQVLRQALLGRSGKQAQAIQACLQKRQLIALIGLTEEIREKLSTNANGSLVSAYCCSEMRKIIA